MQGEAYTRKRNIPCEGKEYPRKRPGEVKNTPIREIHASPKQSSKRYTPDTNNDRDERKDTPTKGHKQRRTKKTGATEKTAHSAQRGPE